jgi:hypothetical protein
MAVESARACGYRKVGGLYLVGGGSSVTCDRLPYPLEECPACGRVAEQNRSHEWPEYFTDHEVADPSHRASVILTRPKPHGARRYTREWVEGVGRMGDRPCRDRETTEAMRKPLAGFYRAQAQAGLHDPICERWTERRLLLWVGRAFYTPEAFSKEAAEMGISRRLTQIPKGLKLGETWVLLAHPDACYEPVSWAFHWLYGDGDVGRAPGVFYGFRPERLELILRQSDATPERIAKEAVRGVTVVAVPDDDKDHQGTVWRKTDEEAAPLAADALPIPDTPPAVETHHEEPGPIGPLDRYDPLGGDA